jgi:hypothetical protein
VRRLVDDSLTASPGPVSIALPPGNEETYHLKGDIVPRSGIIWTIVGILLIVALLIYIF